MRQRAVWLWGGVCAAFLSLTAVACEDPPAPTQTGAFFIQFTDSGIACNVANHQEVLGTVGDTGKPELVADGASNSAVSCTVKSAGGGFIVEAELDAVARLQIEVPTLSEANTIDAPANGQIKYASDDTGGDVYSTPQDAQCTFWIEAEKGQYIKAGEAWFGFDCDRVINGAEECSLNGYVALKNCTGLPEPEE